jgi:hypothetical protein
MRIFVAIAIFVSVVFLPSCGFVQRSFKSSQPPVVTVESARMQATSDADAARIVYVDLLAENPNPDDLPILSVAYTATISDGASSFQTTGMRVGQATISRYSAQRLAIPVAVPVSALANPTSFVIRGDVEYLRPSAIAQTLNENGAGGSTRSFEGAGAITAPQ